MSGVFGLYKQDGDEVEQEELRSMASMSRRRGPERTGTWQSSNVGLGHTLLATTPEAATEALPFEHAESGCVITGDIRLDVRDELLCALQLADRATGIGDAEIVLRAYLEWGEGCIGRFLGDFAFAIWDPRIQRLFCARDQMGMRSLYYHHSPRQFLAFATEPQAILVLPQTPYRVNEARIADFLVEGLEGVDKTSTFFDGVFRLPPAHAMTVGAQGMRQWRYWRLEPEPELRLATDEAYGEAFLDVFNQAVRSRLRRVGPPASTLSGGIDSGTVTVVARRLLEAEHTRPLLTLSAVSADGELHPETRAVFTSLTMDGLEPHLVSYDDLPGLFPDLDAFLAGIDEPFDGSMTLMRSVYLSAQRLGVKALLDGAGGDTVLTEGRWIAHLLRSGRWRSAYREARGWNRFCRGACPPGPELLRSARAAFVPDAVLRHLRPLQRRRRLRPLVRDSLISEELAQRVELRARLDTLASHSVGLLPHISAERASAIDHPFLTVGRERYERVAADVGVEPRDPFLDLRVAKLSVRLPGEQTFRGGWPKAVLRRAMAHELPDAVCWRRGRDHLGPAFTNALVMQKAPAIRDRFEAYIEALNGYVDARSAELTRRSVLSGRPASRAQDVYTLLVLGDWLRRYAKRPVVQAGERIGGLHG